MTSPSAKRMSHNTFPLPSTSVKPDGKLEMPQPMTLLPEPMSLAASGIRRKLPVAADRPAVGLGVLPVGRRRARPGVEGVFDAACRTDTTRVVVEHAHVLDGRVRGGDEAGVVLATELRLAVTRDAEMLRRHVLRDLWVIGSESRATQLPDDVARGAVDQEDRVQVSHGHEDVAEVRARRVFVDRDRVAVVDVSRRHAVGRRTAPRRDRQRATRSRC